MCVCFVFVTFVYLAICIMRINKVLWIILGILLSLNVNAQEFNSYIDSIFGLNPKLYNGQHNPNNIPANIKGQAFFDSPDYKIGTVTINNITYYSIKLNYDIYNQDILINYIDRFGSNSIIRLSNLNISRFSIANKIFETFDAENKIFQSIGNGKLKIYYSWQKIIEFKSGSDYRNYKFSKPIIKRYIRINDKLLKYKNNRSFLRCFNIENKNKIKDYIKANKIKVQKASDRKIHNLITYCNSLKV